MHRAPPLGIHAWLSVFFLSVLFDPLFSYIAGIPCSPYPTQNKINQLYRPYFHIGGTLQSKLWCGQAVSQWNGSGGKGLAAEKPRVAASFVACLQDPLALGSYVWTFCLCFQLGPVCRVWISVRPETSCNMSSESTRVLPKSDRTCFQNAAEASKLISSLRGRERERKSILPQRPRFLYPSGRIHCR